MLLSRGATKMNGPVNSTSIKPAFYQRSDCRDSTVFTPSSRAQKYRLRLSARFPRRVNDFSHEPTISAWGERGCPSCLGGIEPEGLMYRAGILDLGETAFFARPVPRRPWMSSGHSSPIGNMTGRPIQRRSRLGRQNLRKTTMNQHCFKIARWATATNFSAGSGHTLRSGARRQSDGRDQSSVGQGPAIRNGRRLPTPAFGR